MEARSEVNLGNGVKTFQVVNTGDVACAGAPVCSPDRKWKAAVESVSLDAGAGNEFRNARVSCIAGPCPFTRIDSDKFSKGGRIIGASVRNWSDTATFVLQAEVFHPEIRDTVQQAYPVIIGSAVNFTLPAAAEGLSLEAEINGTAIVSAGAKPVHELGRLRRPCRKRSERRSSVVSSSPVIGSSRRRAHPNSATSMSARLPRSAVNPADVEDRFLQCIACSRRCRCKPSKTAQGRLQAGGV